MSQKAAPALGAELDHVVGGEEDVLTLEVPVPPRARHPIHSVPARVMRATLPKMKRGEHKSIFPGNVHSAIRCRDEKLVLVEKFGQF